MTPRDAAGVELRDSDLALLEGLTASLEGYLRLDPADPTGRAHALRHLARRAVDDLSRDLALDPQDGAALADEVAALRRRLRHPAR